MGSQRRKLTGGADFQRILLCRMLKAARLGRDLAISEVVRRTGISHSTITLIENGHRDPSVGTVLVLLDEYGLVFDLNKATDDEPEPADRSADFHSMCDVDNPCSEDCAKFAPKSD